MSKKYTKMTIAQTMVSEERVGKMLRFLKAKMKQNGMDFKIKTKPQYRKWYPAQSVLVKDAILNQGKFRLKYEEREELDLIINVFETGAVKPFYIQLKGYKCTITNNSFFAFYSTSIRCNRFEDVEMDPFILTRIFNPDLKPKQFKEFIENEFYEEFMGLCKKK